MDGWTMDGGMDGWMNGWVVEWMGGWMSWWWVGECVVGWMDGC